MLALHVKMVAAVQTFKEAESSVLDFTVVGWQIMLGLVLVNR